MPDKPARIQLCLVSHTNAGKTTLARTLLGADVGEVRDAAHVTQTADAYRLLATDDGDELYLWDTPGFGDSARLAKRLGMTGNPLGWFLTEVWDRVSDRAFWLSQRALQAARDNADVVLYLVNAAEDPQDAGYVAPEMQILQWLDKPVVVLLNQMGAPRPAAREQEDVARWARHVQPYGMVREVVPLDAFARSWVHERVLFDAIRACLPAATQPGYARLVAAWEKRNLDRFHQSMALLAQQIVAAAQDTEPVGEGSRIKSALGTLGLGQSASESARDKAMAAITARLSRMGSQTTARLLALHGLQGSAAAPLNQRLRENFAFTAPVDVKQAGLLGAIASGAATGASADLLAGGLTLGGGMLVGAVVGAATFAGAAWGINKAKGTEQASARLTDDFLRALVVADLLRYLAIIHFGRGRGDYVEGEAPPFWRDEVTEVVRSRDASLLRIWDRAREDAAPQAAAAELAGVLEDACLQILRKLYPGATLPSAAH
ncbi:GTP-binding domain-containing protein [Pigmentiphaga sp. NML080357]|uniref:GTPase domain-containing protein n=1 Tax=Pigmentiphaga sp. NML080357 TaxID=2008675 RepID=UPI000B41D56A|nr:GTPase domain-containing protein [Pigmentiphaga sp. NML080357]OVZ56857.1 GTP-binding domain-containing protein [Pigmentiphaga sp. NML080357]